MILAPTTELNTQGFVLMCQDLQKMAPGVAFGDILKATTAQILSFCIDKTKAASRAKITQRVATQRAGIGERRTRSGSTRFTFPGGEQISQSTRHPGHISFLDHSTFVPNSKQAAPRWSKDGKTWHDMTTMRWSNERWAKFQSFMAQLESLEGKQKKGDDLTRALASRGLAKHSWYQIAEAIGVHAAVRAAAWVKSAKPQDGREYQNGTAKIMLETAAMFIEVFNTNKAAIGMNGQWIINNAIAARTTAFERDVDLGVFRDFKTRAERYPGIFVTN